MENAPKAIDTLSFEDALAELESIVRSLEEGKGSLDGNIKAYERGHALKKHCETKLREASTKVEKIMIDPAGGVSAQATNMDEGV